MRMTSICIALLATTGGPDVTHSDARNPHAFLVAVKARTNTVVAGRPAWYEVTIHNAGSTEQILDLKALGIFSVDFVGTEGAQGFSGGAIGDRLTPQKCEPDSVLTVILPGRDVTTLVSLGTPANMAGKVTVHVGVAFFRVTDLTNCAGENVEAPTVAVSVHVQPHAQ